MRYGDTTPIEPAEWLTQARREGGGGASGGGMGGKVVRRAVSAARQSVATPAKRLAAAVAATRVGTLPSGSIGIGAIGNGAIGNGAIGNVAIENVAIGNGGVVSGEIVGGVVVNVQEIVARDGGRMVPSCGNAVEGQGGGVVAPSSVGAIEAPSLALPRGTGRGDKKDKAVALLDRRRRLAGVMKAFGFEREFATLPEPVVTLLCYRKSPDPTIDFDDTYPRDAEAGKLRRYIERRFRAAAFEVIKGSGTTVTFRDYQAFVPAVLQLLTVEPHLPKRDATVTRFCDTIRERFTVMIEECQPRITQAVFLAVQGILMLNSRCDERWLEARHEWIILPSGTGPKQASKFTVSVRKPEVRDISIDGKRRPAYRVMRSGATLTPIAWTGEQLRWRKSSWAQDGEYAVYAQSHAMVQLYDRLDDPSAAPWVSPFLGESLAAPKIVDTLGSDLLVEFRLNEQRVGYLVCTPLHAQRLIVVRTFLFLTMEPTPEAQRIAKKLKLGRDDLNWLRLQKLSGFTRTDLGDDPTLRAKLDACGCGHLFTLRNADFTPPEGSAAEVRRYLRWAA